MMKIFHTDKNHVPEAKLISQAIVKAAELLSNKKFEEAYRQYGQQKLPITSESINWGELRQAWNAILKYYLEVKSRWNIKQDSDKWCQKVDGSGRFRSNLLLYFYCIFRDI